MSKPLSIVFAGTPDFAAAHLAALLASEHRVLAVYTQPDRPAGRGKKLQASPVKALALEHDLPVYQPLNFKAQADRDALVALQPDVLVVVAYGLLLPQAVLDIPRHGCLNVHASILPRWRGAAPIQRAIEAGDSSTGVTIMQMERGLDTGPMLHIARCAITEQDTGGSLHDKLRDLGAPALLQTLQLLANGALVPQQQDDSLANYAHKIDKADLNIDWQASAQQLALRVRAFNPFPVCFTFLDGQRVKVFRARVCTEQASGQPGELLRFDKTGLTVACGDGALVIEQLQLPGKKPMTADQLLNGYKDTFAPGRILNRG